MNPTLSVIITTIFAAVIFTLWPQIDQTVTRLFFGPQGFAAAHSEPLNEIREILYGAIYAMLLLAISSFAFAIFGKPLWGVPIRIWGFISALFLLGPGFLVNTLLKGHWGRARPDAVAEFGGTMQFSPALIPSDQCPSNCSFVSGEGAGATALFIAIFVLLPFIATQKWHSTVLAIAAVICGTGIALRVAMGRHFLSDTIFAMLFVTLIALILHRVIIGPKRLAPNSDL